MKGFKMYPTWITEIFDELRCTKCEARIDVKQISSMGVERPMTNPLIKSPILRITAACPSCGCVHRISESRPIDDIMNAVHAHCGRHGFEDDEDVVLPSPNYDSLPIPSPPLSFEGTPRLRSDPQGPQSSISDSEFEQFRRLLKRTSFKRKTSGYRSFMNRLGIQPENN